MIKDFIKKHNLEYYEEADLKRYNTYRINAKAKYLVFPNNKEDLKELLKYLKNNSIKYLVIGAGSNIILNTTYYDGAIILLNKLNKLKILGNDIEVEAGYSLQKLALETANLGLEGLEFATGIPGLIGASIAMNAGAYNNSISEVVESVEIINKDFEFISLPNNKLDFNYRSSIFKKEKDYIIVSAKLKLRLGDKEEILERISKRRVKRLETQPLDMPSAGSVFRNPDANPAGKLIEECGLKGYSIGGAQISPKHANFIVNKGEATGEEIVKLIEQVKNTIKETYNIDLILEQIIIE